MPLTNYYRNKLVDAAYRAQAFSEPATRHLALLSAASPTGGTEVTTGGVVRVAVAASLANWAGTQGAGTTTASTGAGGTTSNNGVITFAASASAAVAATHIGIYDAASAGNLLEYYAIKDSGGSEITRNWIIGDPVTVPAGQLQITLS